MTSVNVRLIGCDIDGTILRSDGSVSDRTRNAIALASSLGVPVCLVTGRRVDSTIRVARDLGLTAPCVAHCGAAIIDPGADAIIAATHLPRDTALSVCALAHGAGVSVAAYENLQYGRGIMVTGSAELDHAARHWPSLAQAVRRVNSYERACEHDPLQITTFGRPRQMEGFLAALAARLSDEVFTVDYGTAEGGVSLVDVFARGVNKGAGLASVAAMYGVESGRLAAFGDSVNDREMLAYVGLPVAMANSDDDLKTLAGVVAPSCDDDGVASIIERLAQRGLLGDRAHGLVEVF